MPYLTINEVSQQLRIHRVTVGKLVQRGELSAIKGDGPNGRVKIDAESLKQYVERHTVRTEKAS